MADIPRINHADAEGVGRALADFLFEHGLSTVAFDGRELQFADAVQFVLRRAAERLAERNAEREDAQS